MSDPELTEEMIEAAMAKADQAPNPAFDRAAYCQRNVVERLINRLKQHRRIATRYEKRAANDLAMLTVTCILLWL